LDGKIEAPPSVGVQVVGFAAQSATALNSPCGAFGRKPFVINTNSDGGPTITRSEAHQVRAMTRPLVCKRAPQEPIWHEACDHRCGSAETATPAHKRQVAKQDHID